MNLATLGCKPNPTGHRAGIAFRAHRAMTVSTPKKADIRDAAPPVKQQGATSSCTGHGTSTAISTTCRKQGVALPFEPSESAIYRNGRAAERATVASIYAPLPVLEDGGAIPLYIMQGIGQNGIRPSGGTAPTNSDADPSTINNEESLGGFEESALNVVVGEYEIDPLGSDVITQLRAAHAAGFAVGYAFYVDTAFGDWQSGRPLPGVPNRNDPNGGGHWIAGVGYDTLGDGKTVPILRNSWGTEYGDAGDWLVTEDWVRAAWTIYVMSVRIIRA